MKYWIALLSLYGVTVFAQTAEDTKPAQIIPPTENPAITQTVTVPKNCTNEGVNVQDKQFMFNNDRATPRIFVLHNTSSGTVMLSHVQSITGAGVLQSKLDPDKWAIVSVSDSNFSMACMLYKPPSIGYVDCASVVSVCSIPTEGPMGGLWVAENNTLESVLNKAKSRGAPV